MAKETRRERRKLFHWKVAGGTPQILFSTSWSSTKKAVEPKMSETRPNRWAPRQVVSSLADSSAWPIVSAIWWPPRTRKASITSDPATSLPITLAASDTTKIGTGSRTNRA